jgi:hypothetical protein
MLTNKKLFPTLALC